MLSVTSDSGPATQDNHPLLHTDQRPVCRSVSQHSWKACRFGGFPDLGATHWHVSPSSRDFNIPAHSTSVDPRRIRNLRRDTDKSTSLWNKPRNPPSTRPNQPLVGDGRWMTSRIDPHTPPAPSGTYGPAFRPISRASQLSFRPAEVTRRYSCGMSQSPSTLLKSCGRGTARDLNTVLLSSTSGPALQTGYEAPSAARFVPTGNKASPSRAVHSARAPSNR